MFGLAGHSDSGTASLIASVRALKLLCAVRETQTLGQSCRSANFALSLVANVLEAGFGADVSSADCHEQLHSCIAEFLTSEPFASGSCSFAWLKASTLRATPWGR